MGHFVGVYTAELAKLESVVGSKSPAHFASVLKACGGSFNTDPQTDHRIAEAVKEIVAGTHGSPRSELEWYYGSALECLCRTFARKWTVEEIYVDEGTFPEIWCFVWGSVEAEEDFHVLEADNPFGIPNGDYGTVFWYRPPKLVEQEIKRLSDLDYDQIAENNDTDYREEVAAILDVLAAAQESGQGVFVTFAE
jgi:hypothetical protein